MGGRVDGRSMRHDSLLLCRVGLRRILDNRTRARAAAQRKAEQGNCCFDDLNDANIYTACTVRRKNAIGIGGVADGMAAQHPRRASHRTYGVLYSTQYLRSVVPLHLFPH